MIKGGSNMTGTNCDLFTHNQSQSYLNHLVSYALLAARRTRDLVGDLSRWSECAGRSERLWRPRKSIKSSRTDSCVKV